MIAVVTGASAGIGRATVRELGRRGATVGLVARGSEGLEGARMDVERLGGRAIAIRCDVSDASAVEAAAERVERELGPIDLWINDAMVSVFSPAIEITPEEYRRVTEVTYLGYVWGTLAALRRMKPRDRGVIVQVGSALALRSIPLQAAYCAAKHAIRGFTESLLCELRHDRSRVRVTMVQMPAVNTTQFDWVRSRLPRRPRPVPPIFQPEVAARAILYAATHKRRDLWVGLPTTEAIVGEMLAPGIADRYLARTGYDAQQTDELAPAMRTDNLFAPVSGDHGAHGRFDQRSRRRAVTLELVTHKRLAFAAVALALAGTGVAALARR